MYPEQSLYPVNSVPDVVRKINQALQRADQIEADSDYRAVKHQALVGTGYFDAIAQIVAGGNSSTTALNGSTEQEQFTAPVKTLAASHVSA